MRDPLNSEALAKNPYRKLADAQAIIKAHKDFILWETDLQRKDVVEWLDEEGNPLDKQEQNILIIPDEQPESFWKKLWRKK